MMIRVMYNDGRFDVVKQGMLDQLLQMNRVASFKRTSGWTVIGRDSVRGVGGLSYNGPERRKSVNV